MSDEIVRVEPLTAIQVKAQVNRMQEVMKVVMQKGVHYGTVPGCGNKPTLLKPGAEKIMATFRLAADPQIEDLSGHDIIRYRIKVNMLTPDGVFVGAGVGECSSDEEKYRWRKAVCDEEFDATEEDRRQDKWKAGWNGPATSIKQVRTNPADIANTVLKMAKKRALVDGVLTATGASDIFTQDIEDMPEEILNPKGTASKTSTVKGKEGSSKPKGQSIQQELANELSAYCSGDETFMKDVLKEISVFKGNDGKEKYLKSIKSATDKWAASSLKALRKRIKEEAAGKEPGGKHPADCTEDPDTCEHSLWQDSKSFCGADGDVPCVFGDKF